MPTYTCTTRPSFLDEPRRAAIARAIKRAHAAATGAPTSFAQIVFEERAHRFIGGEPAEAHVMVRGDIRSGRAPAIRTGLAEAIAREVAGLAGLAAHEVWVYLNELAPGDMVEFGHVLPLAGEEDAWLAALPADLRAALVALAAKGAKD
jgi:phenylpyruvate tautomerase PptA (4-oxalocrotonate tautomerase family)